MGCEFYRFPDCVESGLRDDKTPFSVTFTDGGGGPPVEDAVNIKLYNGASHPLGLIGEYCGWDSRANGGQGGWVFGPLNGLKRPFNYVNRVCSEMD